MHNLSNGVWFIALRGSLTKHYAMSQVLNSINISIKVKTFAKRWAQAAKHKDWDRQTYIIKTGNCTKCPKTGDYVIAPVLDGRIVCMGKECPAPQKEVEVKVE